MNKGEQRNIEIIELLDERGGMTLDGIASYVGGRQLLGLTMLRLWKAGRVVRSGQRGEYIYSPQPWHFADDQP